ncbi:Scr1 family TA system antitoxin-like transcriptional regulator [Streptomyces sp. ICBB 8177]|uniref:Scr1 family TA system antitoxin-like transcriptional regulator n=1 Tax=Streptomyces sp. ICBB 8177 TaxID=563922 RepID=UPI00316AD9A7
MDRDALVPHRPVRLTPVRRPRPRAVSLVHPPHANDDGASPATRLRCGALPRWLVGPDARLEVGPGRVPRTGDDQEPGQRPLSPTRRPVCSPCARQVELRAHRLAHRRVLPHFPSVRQRLDQPQPAPRLGQRGRVGQVTRALIDHVLEVSRQRNVEIQIMPLLREAHAGLDGPMQLLETAKPQWYAYVEGQRGGLFISDPKEISVLQGRYARMRSQALTLVDSEGLLRELRGAL